jgi:predicted thioesterase
MDALRQVIRDDEDSLGTRISLSHQAPVWAGTTLTITARCVSVTGRVSRWDVSAHDQTQTIACGWAEFAVVRTTAFLQRHVLTPTTGPTLRSVTHPPHHDYAPHDRDLVTA